MTHLPIYPSTLVATALLHSLWEVPLLAVVCRVPSEVAPAIRYRRAWAAMTLGVVLPVLTAMAAHYPMFDPVVATEARARLDAAARGSLAVWLVRCSPWVTMIWGVGCLAAIGRLALGLRRLWLTVDDADVSVPGRRLVAQLAPETLGRVAVRETATAGSPFVVGLRRPVLVFPTGLFDRLPSDEAHAVVRHELAHLARRDYGANLLQLLIESLAWFNPGMATISRDLREAREECCDADAARTGGTAVALAKALVRLEETKLQRLAVGLAGTPSSLGQRVRRLLAEPTRRESPSWIGHSATAALVGAIALGAGWSSGMVVRRAMPIQRIEARDPAGPFIASVLGARLLAISVGPNDAHIEQHGKRARVVSRDGTPLLDLTMEVGGFQWRARH